MKMDRLIPTAMATAVLLWTAVYAADFTKGTIIAVDESARTITLDHGEITNLQMPAMTMTFRVGPDVDITKLRQGSDVEFTADSVGDEIVVTAVKR